LIIVALKILSTPHSNWVIFMFFGKRVYKKNLWPLLITLILTTYQLIRLIAFIDVYGGVEHDGGWMLSISRSLAERGSYTTMVSTIVDPTVPGAINVDQKFDVQVEDGRIWFFTGNGIGPASIVPDALVLKIFGTDFWALRAGPLIFYTLFLLLAAYILYQLAGSGAIVLFHAFLFFYPHISIFLGYEAMGEVPSMFYVLWAYLAFVAVAIKPHRRWRRFFLAGLVAGLAVNAKWITLWSISGIFIWAGGLWLMGIMRNWSERRWQATRLPRTTPLGFGELLALGSGAMLPPVLWEIVHVVILSWLTNFELYLRNTDQRLKFLLDDGSGVGLRIHAGPEFFWDKFFLLAEVAHPQRWVTAIMFAAILLGGLALLWRWRHQPQKQNLLALLWFGWLANTAWFVSLAKTGWARHFWFGLVLAAMLLCVISVAFVKHGFAAWPRSRDEKREPKIHSVPLRILPGLVAGSLLLGLIVWGFVSQPHVWGFFLPDEIVPYWQEKQIHNKYHASLPWIIIPRAAQAEAVNYIKQMPPAARVYYPAGHKSSEIPPQTGRMQYPLARRNYVTPQPDDIVLIGPSIISPWQDPVKRQDLLRLVEQECPHPALKNDFYIICPIKDNLVQ
jgi:hypothetical protein